MAFLRTIGIGALVIANLGGGTSQAADAWKDWAEVVTEAKQVLKSLETEPEWAEQGRIQQIQDQWASWWISTSHADDVGGQTGGQSGDRCAYGGWVSVRNASGRCSIPAESKTSACGAQFNCNPLLFGDGICVDVSTSALRSTTFSRCEQKFKAKNPKDPYQYLQGILADPARQRELENLLEQVQEICTKGVQSKTPMCARFLGKLSGLRKKLKQTEVKAPEKTVAVPKTAEVKVTPEKVTQKTIQSGQQKEAVVSTPKNESCTSCPPPTEPVSVVNQSKVSEVLAAYQADAKAVYARIKDKYLKDKELISAECHPYSQLSPEGKEAFFVSLFSKEVRAFAEVFAGSRPELTPDQAMDRLSASLGWSTETKQKWTTRARSLPPADLGLSSDQLGRLEKKDRTYASVAAFQRELIHEIKAGIQKPQMQRELAQRAARQLEENGVADCDFISEESFVEAYHAAKGNSHQPERAGVLTILDRSSGDIWQKNPDGSYKLERGRRVHRRPLPRRMLTVDLKQEKVLFHSEVSFGDGNPSKTTYESAKCSNEGQKNHSPQGLFVTTTTRAAKNGVFSSGTFIRTPKENGKEFRGIAFHESGVSPLGKFFGENTGGTKLKNASSSYASLIEYLRGGTGLNPYAAPGHTDGCVGIPQERIREANQLLEGGSFVYFYCK